jgi:hypothetical protein
MTQPVTASSDWRRVQRLVPGTRVAISASGVSGERHFVYADAQSLFVVNVAVADLTDRARGELIDAATRHPDRLMTTDRIWYAQEHVRIGPDGVFVDERRVSDRAAVLQEIDRSDVREVTRPKVGAGRSAGWGGVGAAIGFFGGVGLATDHSRDAAGRAFAGGFVGAAIGTAAGILAAGRSEKIIYRAGD